MEPNDLIIDFIKQYTPLTEKEITAISEQNLIRHFKKNTLILCEGQYANECYFVLKGCVRSYFLIDGIEKTTDFFLENDSITPSSYLDKKPSTYYLSCLEDCVIAIGDEKRNEELIKKVPALEGMIVKMTTALLNTSRISLDDFKVLGPEMRYIKLLETRPELFQRAPLQYIASYLGITPVSLSRMRKRIATKPLLKKGAIVS